MRICREPVGFIRHDSDFNIVSAQSTHGADGTDRLLKVHLFVCVALDQEHGAREILRMACGRTLKHDLLPLLHPISPTRSRQMWLWAGRQSPPTFEVGLEIGIDDSEPRVGGVAALAYPIPDASNGDASLEQGRISSAGLLGIQA